MPSVKSKIRSNDKIVMMSSELTTIRSTPSQKSGPKPVGLWYGIGTSWIDWVNSEMPRWRGKYIYKLEISGNLLRLKSAQDIHSFARKYGISDGGMQHWKIDWKQVASKYGGIEIAPYQASVRMKYMWYYTWDVASGCIWNKSLIKSVKKIGF